MLGSYPGDEQEDSNGKYARRLSKGQLNFKWVNLLQVGEGLRVKKREFYTRDAQGNYEAPTVRNVFMYF